VGRHIWEKRRQWSKGSPDSQRNIASKFLVSFVLWIIPGSSNAEESANSPLDWKEKCINGVKHRGSTNRVSGVGAKHFRTNRICLRAQAFFFDQRGFLLIIPILTKDAVKNWDGQAYNAIVLAGGPDYHQCYREIGALDGIRERGTTTIRDGVRAKSAEINTAQDLLWACFLIRKQFRFQRAV
jgi:hypothetical protein